MSSDPRLLLWVHLPVCTTSTCNLLYMSFQSIYRLCFYTVIHAKPHTPLVVFYNHISWFQLNVYGIELCPRLHSVSFVKVFDIRDVLNTHIHAWRHLFFRIAPTSKPTKVVTTTQPTRIYLEVLPQAIKGMLL